MMEFQIKYDRFTLRTTEEDGKMAEILFSPIFPDETDCHSIEIANLKESDDGLLEVSVNTRILKDEELEGFDKRTLTAIIDILMYIVQKTLLDDETQELYLAETEFVREDGMIEKQLFDETWPGVEFQGLDEDEDGDT